jgi:hypothetical protein
LQSRDRVSLMITPRWLLVIAPGSGQFEVREG